jgi:hypothetical protein
LVLPRPPGMLTSKRCSEQPWEDTGPSWPELERDQGATVSAGASVRRSAPRNLPVFRDSPLPHSLTGIGRAAAATRSRAVAGGLPQRLMTRAATPIDRPPAPAPVRPACDRRCRICGNRCVADKQSVYRAPGGCVRQWLGWPASGGAASLPKDRSPLGSVPRRPKHPIRDPRLEGYASGFLIESTPQRGEPTDGFRDRRG